MPRPCGSNTLDVQPQENGSRVRHTRLAPLSGSCPNDITVRGIEKNAEMRPRQLLDVNICSMDVDDYISRFPTETRWISMVFERLQT
jgi:hypothetical protein